MRATSIIYRRELGAYVRSPFSWVLAAVILLVQGILFQAHAMAGEQLSVAQRETAEREAYQSLVMAMLEGKA